MSFIGDILGGAGATSSFQAQRANITPTATKQQIDEQYGNANGALKQTQDMNAVLQQQNGVNNLNNAYGMVQNTANGMGPNPALMQLEQQTAANTANQAALMAGQRGVGANAGLIARQAAMQGASNQQNMNGQAATLQAQQQLAAQGQLAGISQQQIANQMQGNQMTNQAAQGLYGQVTGNMNNFNNAQVSNMSQANTANQSTAAGNAKTIGGAIGGIANAGGAALGLFAHGGEVPTHDGAKSRIGMHLKGATMMKSGGQVPGKASVAGDSYANDKVQAIVSPKEIILPRSVTMSKDPAAAAAKFVQAILAKKGMKAPNAR